MVEWANANVSEEEREKRTGTEGEGMFNVNNSTCSNMNEQTWLTYIATKWCLPYKTKSPDTLHSPLLQDHTARSQPWWTQPWQALCKTCCHTTCLDGKWLHWHNCDDIEEWWWCCDLWRCVTNVCACVHVTRRCVCVSIVNECHASVQKTRDRTSWYIDVWMMLMHKHMTKDLQEGLVDPLTPWLHEAQG